MSRSFSSALLPVLLALLSGCAGQQAYRDGRELLAQHQVPAGLQKLQEALQQDPGNAQYRSAYLQARERATSTGLQQAERQAQTGQGELARASFLGVLDIDAQNERANSGLRALERAQRQGKLLADARTAFDAKQYDPARQRLNAILTEQPNHAGARALLREVDEKTAPPVVESGLAKSYKQPITIEFQHPQKARARQLALPRLRLALGLLQAGAGGPFARLQVGAAVLHVAGVLLQRFLQLLQAGRHLVLRDQLAPVAVSLLPGAAGQQRQQYWQQR